MTLPTYLIQGASLSTGRQQDFVIEQGTITETGVGLSRAGATVIDATGLIALSGLVDLHTHLREPGGEGSETVLSGSRAAAAGGYTTTFAMANTAPVADTAGVVEQVHSLGQEAGYVTVRPIGAVTRGLEGKQLADIGAMAQSKARVTVFSDDGKCVSDSLLMRRALEYVKGFDGVIAQHAQDPQLTIDAQMNESELSSTLGLAGWPSVAEESIIARDVLLANHVGARLHVCHVSTAGSVEVIRWAKSRGIQVTAEVTPHHLMLTEELVRSYDSRYKVNPPLRRQEDVLALREALVDGTIDVVATDHAPHKSEAKCCEWNYAAMGMVGLETALPVVYTALRDYDFGWEQIERVMSHTPAKIGRLSGHGVPLEIGASAEFTLVDPTAQRTFATEHLVGKSQNSPFLGVELSSSIQATFHQGYPTVLNAQVLDSAEVRQFASAYRAEGEFNG